MPAEPPSISRLTSNACSTQNPVTVSFAPTATPTTLSYPCNVHILHNFSFSVSLPGIQLSPGHCRSARRFCLQSMMRNDGSRCRPCTTSVWVASMHHCLPHLSLRCMCYFFLIIFTTVWKGSWSFLVASSVSLLLWLVIFHRRCLWVPYRNSRHRRSDSRLQKSRVEYPTNLWEFLIRHVILHVWFRLISLALFF